MKLLVECLLTALGLVVVFSVFWLLARFWYVVAIALVAWICVGCAPEPQRLSFDYHDATPAQVAELDCALSLFWGEGLSAGGDVWVVDALVSRKEGEPVWGRTLGRDDSLSVYLVRIPAMPQTFVHELVHVLEGQRLGTRDPDHANPLYFGPQSLAERLTKTVYEQCQSLTR